MSAATIIADMEHRARYWRSSGVAEVPVGDAAEDFAQECERAAALLRAPRGTDAQILKERELTAAAISGAMAFGAQGVNQPPAGDHWLAPFWRIGAEHAEMLAILQTIVRVADGRAIPGNLILDENSPLMGAARDAIRNATGSAA